VYKVFNSKLPKLYKITKSAHRVGRWADKKNDCFSAVVCVAPHIWVKTALVVAVIGIVVLIICSKYALLALGADMGDELLSLCCGEIGGDILDEFALFPRNKITIVHFNGVVSATERAG
jgi:hypothetical protein